MPGASFYQDSAAEVYAEDAAGTILEKLKTVDGEGSGLDADLLDGQSGSYYLSFANATGGVNGLATAIGYTPANKAGDTFSGAVTISGTAATPARLLNMTGTTTAFAYAALGNTGGSLWWGVEGSTAAQVFANSLAYASIVGSSNATAFQLASNAVVRVTLDATGNVGIGTANPANKLHVNGASYTSDNVFAGAGAGYWASGNTSTATGWYEASGAMLFRTGSVERVRIASDGNFGVNTATPSDRLHVKGALRLEDATDSTTRDYQIVVDTSGALNIIDTVGPANKLHIAFDGKVGLGTTSPTAILDANGNSIRVRTARTPASATASGNAGEICWDSGYVYVCVAANTWKRAALTTW